MARKKKSSKDALLTQVRLGIQELDKVLAKIESKRAGAGSNRRKRRRAARI